MTAQVMERHAESQRIQATARSVCATRAGQSPAARITSVRSPAIAEVDLEALATSAAAQLQAFAASEGVRAYSVQATASRPHGSGEPETDIDFFIESPEREAALRLLVYRWQQLQPAAGPLDVSVRVIDWYAMQ